MRYRSEDKFKEIMDYIYSYLENHSTTPSFREIAKELRISLSSLHGYITELQERGILRKSESGRIELEKPIIRTKDIPIMGTVVCGEGEEVDEYIEGYMALPVNMVSDGDYFLLRTHGNSMIDAGIEEGDLVLIRQQQTAKAGQIVVAEYDCQTTLKRIFFDDENKLIHLHPENSEMDDIVVRECNIQGIATKLIRDLV